jgi:Restriction endonuclease NaeI
MLELFPEEAASDPAFQDVWQWLLDHPRRAKNGLDLEAVFSRAIRQALDEVIDGPRTGRFRYSELETQEKAYIGTRIEIVVRTELGLEPEGKLDTLIEGHAVDFKWSARAGWMIPTEAVGEICLLVAGDEDKGTFSVGLARCEDEMLNKGANKDSKRTISKAGKKRIRWFVEDGRLPISLLAVLDPEIEAAVFAERPGQARVRAFFKRMMRQPIPRDVICTLAMQEDPLRRVRQDRGSDGLDGMKILSGHFVASKTAAAELGYGELAKNEFMAVPIGELRSLSPELQTELKL